ncbi:MAG: exodeoxyribonuclease VII large subunit, partial [Pseudomonadota bacterium]
QRFTQSGQRLASTMQQLLRQRHEQVHTLLRRLRHPGQRLQDQAQRLDTVDLRLRRAMQQRLQRTRTTLAHHRRRLLVQDPRLQLHKRQEHRGQLERRLQRAMLDGLRQQRHRLERLSRTLDAVSPLQTLARGYSLTMDAQGELVRDSATLRSGDHLITRFHRGQVTSIVKDAGDPPEPFTEESD